MSADLGRAAWRKSSRSGGNGGACVEIARNVPGAALVRDSKLGEASPVLTLRPQQFDALVGTVKSGRFD